ncbi:ketoacyl-ACP synthase III [Shewanella saliphila]|uniref:3-oxoacyl-ACP synthase n=1 Tax=Shewanella saliphila TaxID=2282698 RepID=A0ABQ2Q4N8_9GAMM|nr:ketoacyl-ACP synthase III [Shewanella saliphila]MCL1099819.1 ketoacyl-ACP synthase III [Shewanella saliphila]GGP44971.1 3-oxoacyl-ACP synthase [Shewanella saliphila]
MEIGIKAVASYIPSTSIDNLEQGRHFGESAEFVESKLGALVLPRKNPHQDCSDLCVEAIEQLAKQQPSLEKENIDALIIVTQNGDGENIPHTAAIVQKKAGLPKTIAAFDVSLGCSGYVYGLYIIKGLLQAAGLKQALLVTADPYSKVIDPADRVTSMLFGDAATASWIGHDPVFKLGSVLFGTDGNGAESLQVKEGILSMNGRQVFNFASVNIPRHIKELLAVCDMSEVDIDAFLIHQGSAAIVDTIARRFTDKNYFIKDLKDTGNTVSSSIPLLIEKHAMNSDWKNIVLSGFGVGFSWASALIHR